MMGYTPEARQHPMGSPEFRRVGTLWRARPRVGWGRCPYAEEFSKIYKIFLRKFVKDCNILAYFSKKLEKPCVTFSRVWTNNPNFLENFENFGFKFNRKVEVLSKFGKVFAKIEASEITTIVPFLERFLCPPAVPMPSLYIHRYKFLVKISFSTILVVFKVLLI